jgi:hypothetical protein
MDFEQAEEAGPVYLTIDDDEDTTTLVSIMVLITLNLVVTDY